MDKSQAWDLTGGLTIEAWIKPDKLPGGGARIVDRITPGGSDGFLLDTHPGNSLRFICGHSQINAKDAARRAVDPRGCGGRPEGRRVLAVRRRQAGR